MKKRGIVWDSLLPWIIGIFVLILILVLYGLLFDKGNSAIDFWKNLLRFKQ